MAPNRVAALQGAWRISAPSCLEVTQTFSVFLHVHWLKHPEQATPAEPLSTADCKPSMRLEGLDRSHWGPESPALSNDLSWTRRRADSTARRAPPDPARD
mmetsp:Transcript_56652/g.122444  ORF Transcript_56652/g.122444 Transcript_56652/m.122444 type:complete len:100 (+) Transcript_56652:614-913(+)